MEKVKFSGLLAAMAERDEKQRTLATLLGLSECAISNRINGKTQWRFCEIEKICEHYNKDYYELFVD